MKGETLFPSFPHCVPGQVRQHCTGPGRGTIPVSTNHRGGSRFHKQRNIFSDEVTGYHENSCKRVCRAGAVRLPGRIESLPLASKISLTKLQCRQKKLWRTCTEPFPATYEKCRGFSRTGIQFRKLAWVLQRS